MPPTLSSILGFDNSRWRCPWVFWIFRVSGCRPFPTMLWDVGMNYYLRYLKTGATPEETMYLSKYAQTIDGPVSGCADGNWILRQADPKKDYIQLEAAQGRSQHGSAEGWFVGLCFPLFLCNWSGDDWEMWVVPLSLFFFWLTVLVVLYTVRGEGLSAIMHPVTMSLW